GIPYQYIFTAVQHMPAPVGKMERREVEETAIANAYFLPETLNVSGDAQTQMLHRGIYAAAVFRAQMKLSGRFAPPDFASLKIDVKDVQWKDAFVTIAVNDLRGTREGIVLDWGGTKRPLLPGSQVPGYTTGATAPLTGDKPIGAPVEFSIPLDFNGSEGIYFAPFGVQNEAALKSNWPDPAFRGAFLPPEDSSVPISDGRRRSLPVLSAAAVYFRIYRVWLRVSDRGGCIDHLDHVVLPIFPRRRSPNIDDRRRVGGRLHVSLHHFAATRLRVAPGRDRTFHRARSRDVRYG